MDISDLMKEIEIKSSVPQPSPVVKHMIDQDDHYWEKFFHVGEDDQIIYRDYYLKEHNGKWWSWNKWDIGTSLTREDAERAIDILHGERRVK